MEMKPRWLRREIDGICKKEEYEEYEMQNDYMINPVIKYDKIHIFNKNSIGQNMYEGLNVKYCIYYSLEESTNTITLEMPEDIDRFCNELGYPGEKCLEQKSPMDTRQVIDFIELCKKRMEMAFTDSMEFRNDRHKILRGELKMNNLNSEQYKVLYMIAKMTEHYRFAQLVEDMKAIVLKDGPDRFLEKMTEDGKVSTEEAEELKKNTFYNETGIALLVLLTEPCANYESLLHGARKTIASNIQHR